jgi:putative GTP pyrophosphokinase
MIPKKKRTKKRKQVSSEKSLRREYDALLPIAERFRREIEAQLVRLVEREAIALGFPIQARTKKWESISGKLDRGVVRLSSIHDLQDLVGLRLILQFRSQADAVRTAIGNTFTVVKEYDTSDRLKDDQFGYSSIHIIVKIPAEWLSVPTMAGLGDLMAEVQIRTLAQHIWAAASHELQYKQESSVPPAIRRAIYRVSALLETIDLELDRVLAQRQKYVAEVAIDPTKDVSELNVDLLEKTLDSLWPPANKDKKEEDYAELLDELLGFQIRTPISVANIINKHRAKVQKEETENLERTADELARGEPPTGTSEERTKAGVYFTHVGLTRTAMDVAYGERWRRSQHRRYPMHTSEEG